MGISPACIVVHLIHAVPEEAEGVVGIRSSGIGVTGDSETWCGFWELNQGPIKKQPVLVAAESSRQPYKLLFDTLNICAYKCCMQICKTCLSLY